MVWLLAERDDETVGGGFALTGWHTPPHRAIGAALVARTAWRRGGHRRARVRSKAGRATRRDRARRAGGRGRRAQHRLGSPARLRGGRAQLATRARPDRDRGAGSRARPRASRSCPGPSVPSWRPTSTKSLAKPCRTSRARRRTTSARSRSGWRATCKARATIRAPSSSQLADDEVAGFAKLSLSPERRDRAFHDLTGVQRAHRGRGIAAALKRTQIAWAKARRLHVAPDLERGPERADPAAERAARLRAGAGCRDRARRYRLSASSIARRPITRARCERNSALAATSVAGSPPRRRAPPDRPRRLERLLGRLRPQRRHAHVGEPDASVADAAVVPPHERGDADGRPVLCAPGELEIRPARSSAELGNADLGQHLPRPDRGTGTRRGRTSTADTVRSPSGPSMTSSASSARITAGRSEAGIAVRERAADRAAMPHLRVADQPRRVRDDRAVLLERADRRAPPCSGSSHRSRATRLCRGRTRARRCGRCRRAATAARSGA